MNERYETNEQEESTPTGAGASNGEEQRQANSAAEDRAQSPERPSGGGAEQPNPSEPPRRGPSLWVVLAVALVALVALAVGIAWSGAFRSGLERAEAVLVGGGEPGAEAVSDSQYYTCGMHPWVILPEPGDCPICHMELVPLDPAKLAGEIAIDPVTVQNIGVRIAEVTEGELSQQVRTVGTVTYNEEAVRDVNTRVSGWIEELHVDETGVQVEAGQPLFELYSPELYAAQQEYLLAYRNRDTGDTADGGGINLLDSARTRLSYFGIGEDQIQRLQETGQPSQTMTITSPHSGVVTEKHATEGMRITPGMRVYRIADLSTVWVMATVYEQDVPYVVPGQPATLTLPHLPGERFEGEVAYVYPYLEEQARAVRVRLEFPNPEGTLKPGMYGTVRLNRTLDGEAVLVPREAIVGTGEREVVFVSLGGGRFEPRDVETGAQTEDGTVEVLEGLEPGEQVVTSGQFLLDSESQMRSALAKMVKGNSAAEQEPAVETAEPAALSELPEPAAQRLTAAMESYFAIGSALANDTLEGVGPKALELREALEALRETELAEAPDLWSRHEQQFEAIAGYVQELGEAQDLRPAREAYAGLSNALVALVRATGVPSSMDQPVHRFVCGWGWVEETPGRGVWLQLGDEPRNPYMGAASGMLACNLPDEHRLMPVTGGETADATATELSAKPATSAEPTEPVAQPEEDARSAQALPPQAEVSLNSALKAYGSIRSALIANRVEGVTESAQRLAASLDTLVDTEVPGEPRFWHEHPAAATARAKALEVGEASGLEPARLAFAGLSRAMAGLLEDTGVPSSYSERLAVRACPMFPPGEGGAVWIQPAGEATNPYMGEGGMLGCSTEPTPLPVTGGSAPKPAPTEEAGETQPAGGGGGAGDAS